MTGLIFAAGLGTRLKPWTDFHPKALVDVGGKPMLQHVIENMAKAGITDIIINVHHMADQIIDFLASNSNFGLDITISDESELLLDTGGAILKAAKKLKNNSPVLIHNADIFTDLDLSLIINRHIHSDSDATLLTSRRTSSRQLLFDADNHLYGWLNVNTGNYLPPDISPYDNIATSLSFNGIHIINHSVIDWLSTNAPSGPFPIIPQYIAMSRVMKIAPFTPSFDYTWIDIGKPDSLEKARKIARSL